MRAIAVLLLSSTLLLSQTPTTTVPTPSFPTQTTGAGSVPSNVPPTTKVDDKKFAQEAALGGLTEVELGKLAAEKAARPEVKTFAQQMVNDHSKANDQLKELAGKENISLPGSLDYKHQKRVDRLSKLSGTKFDKAYLKDQLRDHETDVKEFNAEAESGTDANVMAFASGTLPVLKKHLEMVKDLSKNKKKGDKE